MNNLSKFAAMIAFLGLFASCSVDDPIPGNDNNDNKVPQENQTLYVKVAIHGENSFSTRAAGDNGNPDASVSGDFQNGNGKESDVSSIYFVFYDDKGNIVGNIVNVDLNNSKTTGETGATVDKFFENTVTVSLLKGQNKPSKVMCYINPISLNDIQKPLDIIQTVTRETVVGEDGLFPMSNSVYYPDKAATTEPVVAVDVTGKVYENKEDADKDTAEPVNIYVERRAARMTFKLNENIYDGTQIKNKYTSATGSVKDNVPYELTFNIDGWDVNAQTKDTYIVKSFRKRDIASAMILADDFNFQEANEKINNDGGDWVWNNADYHRAYWAVSPAYFVKLYPEVASDVTGDENLLYIYPEKDGQTYRWNQNLTGEPVYYREATIGRDALDSKNPAAAVASVVLKGHYTIGNKEIDFYTFQKNADGKFFVFPKESADLKTGGMTMKERFMELQSVLYKKISEKEYQKLAFADLETQYSTITIQHPDKEVLKADPTVEGATDMKVASRHQTLQLTGVPSSDLYYASGKGYTKIDADNLKNVNLALIQQLGFASFYKKGQAYFNIPIKHLGWYRGANTQIGKANIDWSIVRVGDFGMVRNHAYNIEVESITGLGTGIGNPGDPIIPPAETKDYYVKYRVNILKWAMVPNQKVNL